MKKNILTIVILALALINVVLSAMIVFVVVPTSNKTNNLIKQVASVIDLELESPDEEEVALEVPIENREMFAIEGDITVNLKKTQNDNKDRFGVISVSLTINNTSKSYKALHPKLEETTPWVKSIVRDVVSKYTFEEAKADLSPIEDEILQKLKEKYESDDFIIEVVFGSANFQ